MKKIVLILFTLSMFSCGNCDSIKPDISGYYGGINTVVVDSCEYIVVSTKSTNGGVAIVHKQNCKNHK